MPTFIFVLGFGYCKSLVTLTFLMMMRDCRLQTRSQESSSRLGVRVTLLLLPGLMIESENADTTIVITMIIT